MKKFFVTSVLILFFLNFFSTENKDQWEILSTESIGAKSFLKEHPTYDGRGVLVAVCDSGVALGLPGLIKTSDGKDKIIDARDFSGQYTIGAEKPIIGDDNSIFLSGEKHLYNYDEVLKSTDKDSIFVGYLKEERAKNSDVKDINGNGKTDDVFGFVLYQDKNDGNLWKVLIDSNGDGDLKGEKSYCDYFERKEYFELKGGDKFSQYAPLNIAVNIDADKKEVSFFMADGSHGTHVAGICAGFKIDNQDGYNGIAPGAQILALKIGNNSYSGGATTEGSMVSAWKYAVKKAKELKMPLVIQMSYGIGSEMEGRAKAEELIDELLYENPDVVAAVSCGNEGPGISSAGLPASAKEVLAIGATIAKTTAKDIYGADLKQDELFFFSSRGAEMLKPDVVCPGFAASTVPLWEEGKNVMRGTSMASPQAAGALAVILSAISQEGLPIRRDAVYSAVRRGATTLNGYTILDGGYGVLNIAKSYGIYKELVKRGKEVLSYDVETMCPQYPDKKGYAVYYRGSFYPKKGERQEIDVFPRFPFNFSEEEKVNFFKAFDVEKTGNFFSLTQSSVYMKSKEPAKIYIDFNDEILKREGLYSGYLSLYAKNSGGRGSGPELVIPVTVIVPYEAQKGIYPFVTTDVEPAKVKRFFYRIKEDSGAVSFKVSLKGENGGKIYVQLFDRKGRENEFLQLSKDRREVQFNIGKEKEKGVYELTLYGNFLNKGIEKVEIEAKETKICAKIEENLKINVGDKSVARISFTSSMNEPFEGSIISLIKGVYKESVEEVKGADFSRSFSIAENEGSVEFKIELSPEDFNLFTDISVSILDEEGKAIAADGMAFGFLEIGCSEKEGIVPGKKYSLNIHSAYADPDSKAKWEVNLIEKHFYKEPMKFDIKDSQEFQLFPDIKECINLSLSSPPFAIPKDWKYIVVTNLKERKEKGIDLIFHSGLKTKE
jgi:tripeptidyl-peptidase-2